MLKYETPSGTTVHLKDQSVDVENVADSVLDKVVDAAYPLYEERGNVANFVITSAHDGTHSEGSLHDDGLAIDLRVWGFTEAESKRVATELQSVLGDKWDVVWEKDHVHIEYDPHT